MYSLMSSWISESSSPNRNSASVLDRSVLPTPDGPAKMNDPPGRLGSFSPALVRLMAWERALIASFWPMTRLCSSSSIRSRRCDSSSVSLNTGMPVPVALEHLDGVLHRRHRHLDGLEPPLQRGDLLQVLAVLIQSGRPDGQYLDPGQHGLEDRGSVAGALGRARAHEGVQLVEEQD